MSAATRQVGHTMFAMLPLHKAWQMMAEKCKFKKKIRFIKTISTIKSLKMTYFTKSSFTVPRTYSFIVFCQKIKIGKNT